MNFMFIVAQSIAATAYIHMSVKSKVPDNIEKYCSVSYNVPMQNERKDKDMICAEHRLFETE